MASFSKVLGSSDAKKQMAVPTEFVQHLPPHSGGFTLYFPVVDHHMPGKVWNFGYYVRDNGEYEKPVFQGEWQAFVRAKKLKAGDRIIFRVDYAAGVPRYTIAAQKPVEVFGQAFGWGDEF